MPESLPSQGLTSETSLKKAVFSQLLMGPSYVEAAAALLRDALEKQYPTLDLDPYTTVVGEPTWDIVEGEIVELATRYEVLSDMLAEQIVENDPVLLIDGLHFLSRLPLSSPVVHLPVRIEQIGCLINELTPAIFAACQEKQLEYWNSSDGSSPRWRALSETLRTIWDVRQVDGWTAAECAMARQLFLHPTLQGRKDHGRYDTHAYLIDLNTVDDKGAKRRSANALMVLTGTIDNEEIILTHSMVHGFKKFDSQQALAQSLPDHVFPKSGNKIQWRFFEPDESIFDQAACAIVSSQIEILGDPGTLKTLTVEEIGAPADPASGPGPQWFKNKLPDWLRTASASDQNMFAELLRDLSALNGSHAGKTYLDEIPSIRSFVVSALKKQMESDHTDASTLDMENIEVEIRSVVVWGSFVVPGKIETTRLSLVELALQNLIALPLGDKTVTSLNGEELPGWMTPDYIANVVSKIDIGRTYPQWVKGKLLDDPAESKRRESLYTSQLRIQLPLLALENKLRGQGGMDERGYRYVAALMEPEEADRKVDGQPIVVRRLAFVPELPPGTKPDTVANMFVIGPQDSSTGPCLLYRPLLEPQLCQYPSFSNLLYAIRQTTSLRQSVLAWLPDEVRNSYSRYIFPGPLPSPWSIVEFVTNPLAASLNSGPIRLSNETLEPDFLPVLFKANAEALVELANRQSVSNSESRWESFKRAGWLIFNLALPYLGATVGNAVWLWQILDDLEKLTQSDETVSTQGKWEIIADLLSNIAVAVTSIALERARKAGSSRPTEAEHKVGEIESLPEIIPEPEIEKLPHAAQTLPAIEHYDTLHTSGALISQAPETARLLAPLSIDKPENPGQPKNGGPLGGLYEQGENRYAQISGKWFKVAVDRERVSIIDGNDPTRVGPLLMSNTQGQWQVDTRLRLRSNGSTDIMQQVIADANRRSIQLFADLNHLEVRRLEKQKLLTMDAQQMSQASGASRDAKREVYLNTLKTQRESYEEALQLLLEWPVSQTRPDSSRTRLGYLNAQVNFTFAEIDTSGERFTPVMKAAIEMSTSGVEYLEQQHTDTANSMIQLGEAMIERLDYMETRFSRLKKLGREGFEFVRQHRKKMPVYKSDDIRLTQLDMYRHLCLSLDSVHTTPEGWTDINQVVDNATVAFQSLRDAIDERSVIRLDEQINALGSLTEQFTAIAEHLEYVAVEYKDNARLVQLNRFKRQVDTMRQRALRHLAQALDERSARRNAPGPYRERPRPRKKFIRTRFWGLVSGEPRLSKMYEETDWVDVKKPFSDDILVTFHRKAASEWVQHLKPDTPQLIPTLQISVAKGRALIDGLTAFKTQIEQDIKKPGITPTGVAMVITAHARRMDTINLAIEKALKQPQSTSANETIEIPAAQRQQQAAEALRVQLGKESKALYALGFTTEQQVIEQSPPTMGNILWLKERQQISITRQKKRQRIKGAQYEYLDRYEIRNRADKKILWFADFQYSKSWTPEHAFLDARLKTPEQVAQEKPIDTSKRLSQHQLIDLYRSEIDVEQAKAVFFAN